MYESVLIAGNVSRRSFAMQATHFVDAILFCWAFHDESFIHWIELGRCVENAK